MACEMVRQYLKVQPMQHKMVLQLLKHTKDRYSEWVRIRRRRTNDLLHPPQFPYQICLCFILFPFSVWQEIVVLARQTCKQQATTLSQTNLPCYNNTYPQKDVCC